MSEAMFMQFVQGLPTGVYVGQTRVQHVQALASMQPELHGFNLALHVGDDPQRVQQHRMILLNELSAFGVDKLTWMDQIHSTQPKTINQQIMFAASQGDGLVTQSKGHALMMMTADCLPMVLGNDTATEVANLHAGWRGLATGIIENTIAEMQHPPTWAWLGAAISQVCFEVGREVHDAFCQKYPALSIAFQPATQIGHYYADLYAIAAYILKQSGIERVSGGDQCTYQNMDYYSYRRQAKTGRMATFVFMQ